MPIIVRLDVMLARRKIRSNALAAAIGITEGSDAISIVVSEETGLVTFVEGGRVIRNVDTATLRRLLLEAMEIPMLEVKREQAKTMKESETEITIS